MRAIDFQSFNIATYLDHFRAAVLRLSLKNRFLRQIYCDRSNRLGLNYIILTAIYLFISLKWSVALLILGPLILGYPHLIASYRFLYKPELGLALRWNAITVFRFFIFLTACSLSFRFLLPRFLDLPKLPYGAWEILLSLSALVLVKVKLNSLFDVLVASLTLMCSAAVLKLAWHDPLAFVGIALIFHNWVALGHWFFAAKDFKNKFVAVWATAIFALIHILVIFGFFDVWISFPEIAFLSAKSFAVRGWVLAPWTSDAMIWNRIIVLYTFGLSMHYFIWLRAIPQCIDQKSVPNSFRKSLQQLRQDCGPKTTTILFVIGLTVGFGMWFHTELAGRIYFGIAMLHGWLEFVFLIMALSAYLLKSLYFLCQIEPYKRTFNFLFRSPN